MDYKKAWKYSNRLTVLAVFIVMLGGYFATRSQILFWGLVDWRWCWRQPALWCTSSGAAVPTAGTGCG